MLHEKCRLVAVPFTGRHDRSIAAVSAQQQPNAARLRRRHCLYVDVELRLQPVAHRGRHVDPVLGPDFALGESRHDWDAGPRDRVEIRLGS